MIDGLELSCCDEVGKGPVKELSLLCYDEVVRFVKSR